MIKKLFTVTYDYPEEMDKAPAAREILHVCLDLASMLIDKNQKYGDSALNPVRCFSKADAVEQIKVRMDDKLSRLMRGEAGGEDAMLDLVGYYVLLRVAELRAITTTEGYTPFYTLGEQPAAASHCFLCKQTFTGKLSEHECPVKDRVNHPG